MKKVGLVLGSFVLSLLFCVNMNAQCKTTGTEEAIKNLKPYPAVLNNLERHVLFLEEKTDENLFKVELIAGKTMEVDCNHHGLVGNFSEETLQGWGYTYHVFATENQVISTLMGCPNNTKTEKFVSAQPITVRYNSRLPIVVYLPEGVELKYRIWTAGPESSVGKG